MEIKAAASDRTLKYGMVVATGAFMKHDWANIHKHSIRSRGWFLIPLILTLGCSILLGAATAIAEDCNANGFADELEVDTDNDGIIDSCDLCRSTYNPDQADADADGYGNACDADFDNNLTVDFADLAFLKSVFFTANPEADLNGDKTVDFADLAILKSMFFSAPGPGPGEVPEGLRPDQRADLKVVQISTTPVYPVPGESVDVRVEVHSSSRTGMREVADRIDVALLANDGLETRQVDIKPDTTARLSFSWVATVPGLNGITAVADPEEKLVERGRADNTYTKEVVVAPRPPAEADFVVTDIHVISLPERPMVPRVTVMNQGTSEGSAPLVVTADEAVVMRELIGPLAPGESVTKDVSYPGDVTLGVVSANVNPRFAEFESNPADNLLSLDIRRNVDLAVEKLSVTALQGEAGQTPQVTISFRVRNVGYFPIPTPFRTRINGARIDPVFSTDVLTPALDVDQAVYISKTVNFTSFTLSVEADVTQVLQESNRSNNFLSSSFNLENPDVGQWISIGPRQLASGLGATGRLMTMAIDPGDALTMYVGSRTGAGGLPGGSGIWKTVNGGDNWQPIGESLPSLAINALAVDPNVSSRIYAVTSTAGSYETVNSRGVFRSEDGGVSWIQVSDRELRPLGNAGARLLIDPDETNRLILPSMDGVYRSEDYGESWNLVLDEGAANSLTMDPTNSAHLIAGIRNDNALDRTGIYESYSSGDNWSTDPLTGCPGDDLPDSVTENTNIRVAMSANQLFTSYKSGRDSSECFTVYRTSGISCKVGTRTENYWEQGWKKCCSRCLWSGLYADPNDDKILYATGVKFWVSRDGGNSFKIEAGSQPHADHHDFAINPQNSQVIYTAGDGGLYRSSDRGKEGTWAFIANGITNVEFYDIADAHTQPDLLIGGTQDNGTVKYSGQGSLWSHIKGGDGATVDIAPDNADVMYAMHQYADQISGSTNGGDNFDKDVGLPISWDPSRDPAPCPNLHYQIHPGNTSILLASCQYKGQGSLWRKPSSDEEWSVIYTPPSGHIVRTAVDPTTDLYYAGASDGRVHAGTAGSSFEEIFHQAANAGVRDIEIDAEDPAVIYVAFGGTGTGRIQRLQRASSAPTSADVTSQDITGNLQRGLDVRAIGVDRWSQFTIYAATNRGVYRGRSADGGTNWIWTPYNSGLPAAVDVKDIHMHPTTGVMRIATLGRGAYKVDTAPPLGSILSVEGHIVLLRIHDVGTGYGSPGDFLDAEVIVRIDSAPEKAFGFKLRSEEANEKDVQSEMLDTLRKAFNRGRPVHINYEIEKLGTGSNYELISVTVL